MTCMSGDKNRDSAWIVYEWRRGRGNVKKIEEVKGSKGFGAKIISFNFVSFLKGGTININLAITILYR